MESGGQYVRLSARLGELIGIATPDSNGLMPKNSFFQEKRITFDEYNNLLPPGTYAHTEGIDNTITGTGILSVFKGGGYVAHVDISNGGYLSIKTVRNTGDILKDWRTI